MSYHHHSSFIRLGSSDVSIFGKTTPWDYLERLTSCLPGTDAFISAVKDSSRSSIARGRVWVRLALNEAALAEYLGALSWNKDLSKNYYSEGALIRDVEYFSMISTSLEQLKPIQFRLFIKDKDLDKPNYWKIVGINETSPSPNHSNASSASSSYNNIASITESHPPVEAVHTIPIAVTRTANNTTPPNSLPKHTQLSTSIESSSTLLPIPSPPASESGFPSAVYSGATTTDGIDPMLPPTIAASAPVTQIHRNEYSLLIDDLKGIVHQIVARGISGAVLTEHELCVQRFGCALENVLSHGLKEVCLNL